MLTADEMRVMCPRVRADELDVDAALVARIESDVDEYRAIHDRQPAQLPPEPLDTLLPLMGWLIYEASLDRLWEVPTEFEKQAGPEGDQSRETVALITRIGVAARRLPWPEFAPRALGAIRVQALIESKRDTEAGYDAAWELHDEAREKYHSFRDSHAGSAAARGGQAALKAGQTQGDRGETDAAPRLGHPGRDRYVLDLDEVLLQLALAENGTACRTAERVIGMWVEELDRDVPAWSEEDSPRWTQRMFRDLSEGSATGELALAKAAEIQERAGFTQRVDELRLALPTSFRNPAIMTCRALLLMYSMSHEMARLGRTPDGGHGGGWEEFRRDIRRRFDRAFGYLRRPLQRPDGTDWPLDADHLRSMVQLCLHLALLTPGHVLEQPLRVDDTLSLHRLDDDAVAAMSAWLATIVDGKQRGDANIIGSASKPSFIGSVEDCREDPGASADYRRWRRDWFVLDRYAGRPGRRDRIERVLV